MNATETDDESTERDNGMGMDASDTESTETQNTTDHSNERNDTDTSNERDEHDDRSEDTAADENRDRGR